MIEGLIETWERRFTEDDGWPVFVVVTTDGPEGSRNVNPNEFNEFNAFVATLVARQVTVHTVVLSPRGGGRQTQVGGLLATATGGLFSSIAAATGLADQLGALARTMGEHYDEVARRYRVVYERPTDVAGSQICAGVVGGERYRLRLFANRRMPPQ